MRVNMGREGRTSSSLSANGGTMLGSLILANGPSQPLEAATKYYVDTAFANLNANNVVEGVLPISSLPGFTGDATSNQGSNTITLANLGVNPGSYAKVIVDSKGRVTGNDVLSSSDLPVVNWSKIQNEPTTVEGYGITDALTTAGGTFTGNLSVGVPTQSLSAVNKQYVDSALSGNSAVVGDIIRKPYASTPSGFLRCNGGLVDKTTYANLYAVLGDNFAVNTTPGSGKPWQQQYQINNTQSSITGSWTIVGSLPGGPYTSPTFIVTKNRVYLLAGYNYSAVINSDGTLGTWNYVGQFYSFLVNAGQAVVYKNKVYFLGGYYTGNLSNVLSCNIDSTGQLSTTWTVEPSFPTGISSSQAIIIKNRIYMLGGSLTNGDNSSVYYSVINSDGTLSSWVKTTSLPGPLYNSQAIVTKNRVYLLGGNTTNNTPVNTVYTTTINTDGTLGVWVAGPSLPAGLSGSQVFITKNIVYLLGGMYTTVNSTNISYCANINSDGTLGPWITVYKAPGSLAYFGSFITNNKLYFLGGTGWTGNSYYDSNIYCLTISGGLNDYSAYYSNIVLDTNPDKFTLPDFTTKEKNGVNFYIKF